MTKTHKITLVLSLILVILLGLLCCEPSFSVVYADDYTSYNNYTYDSYRVDIVVREDNSYDITETVTMTYGSVSDGLHQGWARAIPYNLNYTTYDSKGAKYSYKARCKVTLVSATELFNSYKEDGNFVIEMKQDGVYVNNQTKEYVIKYNYSVGYDFISFKDFFNYNIIGNDFPVDVNNVEFSITMPKSFDASSLKFYTGTYGETTQYTDYSVSGNVISSNAPINLSKWEALTVNLDLPEGYFAVEGAKAYNTIQTVFPIVGAIAIIVLAIVLFVAQNRNTPTQVVEFYAPDDLSPGECKYILDGKVSSLDVSSIIVVWASRGLVKILLDDNKKPTKIARIKDAPAEFTKDEKLIWDELFKSNDIVDVDFSMSVSEKMNTVAQKIKIRYNQGGSSRFTSKSQGRSLLLAFLSAIVPFAYIIALCKYHSIEVLLPATFSAVALPVFTYIISYKANNKYSSSSSKGKKWLVYILYSLIIAGVGAITYLFTTANIIDKSYMFVWYFAVSAILYFNMLGKTLALNKKVFDYYGRVAGFKNAIEHAEADMLKKLVKEDPEYFYKVIPYAHVFGIYEKFVNNFKGFAMPINEGLGDTFTTILILDNMRYRARYNMMKSYASKAGSSFGGHGGGGGGFSGGGFGGGGGRGL